MRWDDLFRDLEAQLEAAERAQLDAEVADRTRRELARVRLVDRLRAAVGSRVSVAVAPDGLVSGTLSGCGPDWLLVREDGGRDALVVTDGVLGVAGLGRRAAHPGSEGPVAARLGLAAALRGLARDRTPVAVVLRSGAVLRGTLDRVGADFVDLGEHAPGDGPRPGAAVARTVPVAALAVVRSAPSQR